MLSRMLLVLTPLVVLFTACAPTQPSVPATPTPRPEATATPRPEPTRSPEPTATPRVAAEPTSAPTSQTAKPRGEYRAFWVDAFHEGFKTPQQVDQLVRDVQTARANAVVVQVRRRGDAYYLKSLEPRTEDPDVTPGFDALQDLIDKAHRQNPRIEVHAWLATLPIWKGEYTEPRDRKHVFHTHGPRTTGRTNWITKDYAGRQFDGGNYSLDPGHPEALDYTVDIYLDVLRKYDVDGLHMDYVRYAEKLWGYNDVSVERFKQRYGRTAKPTSEDPLWGQWRRDQITALARKLYLKAIAIKPQVKISGAMISWQYGPVKEEDWLRSSPVARTFQDWRAWLEEGIIDIAMPMAYFRESEPIHVEWYDQWIEWTKNHRYNRHVSIGLGIWQNSLAESFGQIRRALAPSKTGQRADGVTLYSFAMTNSKVPDSNEMADRGERLTPAQWEQIRANNAAFYRGLSTEGPGGAAPLFANSVPTPDMPWKTRPTAGHLMGTVRGADGRPADGATVTIAGPTSRKIETDGTGFYGFVDLRPGQYTITATLGGKTLAIGQATIEVGKVASAELR